MLAVSGVADLLPSAQRGSRAPPLSPSLQYPAILSKGLFGGTTTHPNPYGMGEILFHSNPLSTL